MAIFGKVTLKSDRKQNDLAEAKLAVPVILGVVVKPRQVPQQPLKQYSILSQGQTFCNCIIIIVFIQYSENMISINMCYSLFLRYLCSGVPVPRLTKEICKTKTRQRWLYQDITKPLQKPSRKLQGTSVLVPGSQMYIWNSPTPDV